MCAEPNCVDKNLLSSKIAQVQSVLLHVRSLDTDMRTVLMQFPRTPTCTDPNYTGTILGILTRSKLYQHKHGFGAEVSWSAFVRPLYKAFDFLLCMHA